MGDDMMIDAKMGLARRLVGAGVLIGALCQGVGFGKAMPSRPNIVVILCDDVGFSDIGCYGGEIPTPNLDALASSGVRFTQFYNAGRCCPSRAALLTGLYPHQAGVGHMLELSSRPGYTDRLSTDSVTMAEVLRDTGYRTYIAGKWHVGDALPLDRGFDRFYGTVEGGANYYNPAMLMRDRTHITAATDPVYKPDKFYYTDAITDHSIQFVKEHQQQSPDKPFFLYVAYTAGHWPLQAPGEEIARHKGRYDAGYDAVRKARFERMKSLGLIPRETRWSDTLGEWDQVEDKQLEAGRMEIYAAMISRMDTGIGKIVEALKAQDKLDNTIVMFMNDNGGDSKEWKGDKAPSQEGAEATRVVRDNPFTFGKKWANVSNTPFRKYKSWTHEGGIATPLIVNWPTGVAPELKNKLVHEPAHLIDLMATVVDVAGTSYPAEFRGNRVAPMAGKSLVPVLQKKEFLRTDPLFWEHQRNCAIRDGDWKLVRDGNQPWELYDLAKDRAELNDLAGKHPERVRQLSEKWEQWAKENDVLPLGGWRKAAGDAKKRR